LPFSADSRASVSLADAVLLHGGLNEHERRVHWIRQRKIEWAKNGDCTGRPLTDDELTEFVGRQLDAEKVVQTKLRSGELEFDALIRGSSLSSGRVCGHPDWWDVLEPDFQRSTACGPGGLILGAIRVFPKADPSVAMSPAAPIPYGQKKIRAHTFIAENAANLAGLSLRKQKKIVANAVGCSATTAQNAIREERSTGHLSGRK
jgi:hypothetical protein